MRSSWVDRLAMVVLPVVQILALSIGSARHELQFLFSVIGNAGGFSRFLEVAVLLRCFATFFGGFLLSFSFGGGTSSTRVSFLSRFF